MATNSYIAVKHGEQCKTIYCHNDGYPDYMYPMLRDWYGTKERAESLVEFGDASFIDKRLVPSLGSGHCFGRPEEDVSIFYHRDRGEDWNHNKPRFYSKQEVVQQMYYAYIFEEDNQWHIYIKGTEASDYSIFG